jgi:AraC family transcriptional regulator, arabinose operon regulatory protein
MGDKTSEPFDGKMDNFYGDRSIVMSDRLLRKIDSNRLIKDLYITDMGYYPRAKTHFRKREKGISEQILIYCIDGKGTIRLKNIDHALTANTCFVIPSGEPHAYWASADAPWSIYWIHYGGEKSNCFENHYARVVQIPPCTSSRIDERLQLFDEILTALEQGFSNENIDYANLCLNSLLATFFYLETYRSVKGFRSPHPVDQAIFFMQDNLHKAIKISDIASFVNLSESHLSRIFRNKTGSSPIDYYINLKMQEAIRLLTNKSLRIKEVAFLLGYDDPFYFSRIFARHIGTSPARFLRNRQE